MCSIIGQQSEVLEYVFMREMTLMGNHKKILNLAFVFSLFLIIPLRLVAVPEFSEEASNDKNISNYIYFPFISTPEPIRIVSHLTCERQGLGLIIDGWIENQTTSTIYSVKLIATMYDQNSESYGPYEIRPTFEATFPNNLNPFVLRTLYGGCEWDKWNHSIEVDSWSFYSPYEYRPVTVAKVEWENYGHWSNFYGTIRNDHEATLHSVNVILKSPQYAGWVIAIYDTILSPGEEVMFSATIMHAHDPYFNDEAVYVLGQGYLEP